MRMLAASLSEQDIADLAAYYESTGTGATLAPRAEPGAGKVAELGLRRRGPLSWRNQKTNQPGLPQNCRPAQ